MLTFFPISIFLKIKSIGNLPEPDEDSTTDSAVVIVFAALLACSFALLFFSIVLAMLAQQQIQEFMFKRGKDYSDTLHKRCVQHDEVIGAPSS